MTSRSAPGLLTRVGAWLVAVLVAVGLLVLSAGTTSVATLPDGQTRVGVSAPETITAAGVGEHVRAGQGRAPPVSQRGIVVATGVAANGGARALDWSRATINDGGVAAVERHLARFESGPEEAAMLGRLRSIAGGEMEATAHDLRFYTHELRESVLYRKAGYPSGQPADGAYELWDQLHTQALTDYGLTRGGAPDLRRSGSWTGSMQTRARLPGSIFRL